MRRLRRPLLALVALVAAAVIGYAVRAADGHRQPVPSVSPTGPSAVVSHT